MDQQEDRCFGAVRPQSVKAVAVVFQVLVHLPRLCIKDVYHDANVFEDGRALGGEVRVHESILATAIPEIEDKVAQEPDVVLLYVDCGTKARRQRRGIVGARKNDDKFKQICFKRTASGPTR